MRSVAVTIVSYQTAELTTRAARSALNAGAHFVTVVDNGSQDATLLGLTSLADERLTVHVNRHNLGFAVGANTGARAADADVLIFLNSDAELASVATTELVRDLEAHGCYAIVGPRLVGPGHAIQRSAGLRPRPIDLAVRALGLHILGRATTNTRLVGPLLGRMRLVQAYETAEHATGPIDTDMVSGACFAIGRDAFLELGGFDERFFMYFEDADLCRRATAAGMPIRYVPSAVVTHIGGASSSEDYHFGPLHARAMRQYLGKWYGPSGSAFALALLWIRAVGMTLMLQRGARRAWRAWWAALRDEDPRR